MKSINIIHPFFVESGGAERKLLIIINSLSHKYKFKIITFNYNKNTCFPELWDNSYDVIKIGYSKNSILKLFYLFKALKKSLDGDFIHVSNFPSNLIGGFLKIFFKKKILWFCNEPLLYLKETKKRKNKFILYILKFIERILTKKFDVIVVNSKFTKKNLKKFMALDSRIIYSGVDTNYYRNLIIKRKKNQLLFLSRIENHKNIDFIILLFMDLKKTYNNLKLFIAGDGSYLTFLKKKYGQIKNLFFLGRISEKQKVRLYSESTIFIFPAKNEPLGVVPIEAMSCELPVIGFNSGGLKETIINGETGFLVKNEKEFKSKVKYLLDNPHLILWMGKRGRQHVINNFSTKNMVKLIDQSYQELLKKNG